MWLQELAACVFRVKVWRSWTGDSRFLTAVNFVLRYAMSNPRRRYYSLTTWSRVLKLMVALENVTHFMEPQYSLLWSQEPSSGLRPEPRTQNSDQPFRPVSFTVNFSTAAPSTRRSVFKWPVQAVRENVVHRGLVLCPNCVRENWGYKWKRYSNKKYLNGNKPAK